jgi:hypothetical protein
MKHTSGVQSSSPSLAKERTKLSQCMAFLGKIMFRERTVFVRIEFSSACLLHFNVVSRKLLI